MGQQASGLLMPLAEGFWPCGIASRTRDKWSELDLTNAGELCRMFADIERFPALIER
ncbi:MULTISPECIES: hypothetical protein [Xanthomonas]|uniref:hypothetical protein n=1 Tax=Xanthomonas TaxID=338 RepID=UPI000247C6F1|nr:MULTISPECIES: hypothetical protein [Xanthomonas]MBE0314846.1 hypothetical protein [Xanthomonas citri pv. punicae]MDS0761637.1 hypothetical protein [Xanthomonas citri pv. punicae]MDS0765418.1 hypothetical protein [Xanthomonas citri pv. punicae]MDS0800181.1 hypothetical protein [Xanthomonas citri pv. punicae]MDS0832822.1 hypothetical protein [Xanthomonas citri pv. punicae]